VIRNQFRKFENSSRKSFYRLFSISATLGRRSRRVAGLELYFTSFCDDLPCVGRPASEFFFSFFRFSIEYTIKSSTIMWSEITLQKSKILHGKVSIDFFLSLPSKAAQMSTSLGKFDPIYELVRWFTATVKRGWTVDRHAEMRRARYTYPSVGRPASDK